MKRATVHDEQYLMKLRQRICARRGTVQHQTKFSTGCIKKRRPLEIKHLLKFECLYFNCTYAEPWCVKY